MTDTGSLTETQSSRYARHIVLPDVGEAGQRKLLDARVVLVGAGGLGSAAGIYLAAAGIGTLGIVDADVVDPSNLQRQVLHHVHDIGRPKTESARESIAAINPDVKVEPHAVRLTAANARQILGQYDVVVGCIDNFPTRYLVNDACVLLGKPLVDGGIFRFEGQASTYLPGRGCYRCLFPNPPPAGSVPTCVEAGVLGVMPGLIGVIQAAETIKVILGIGRTLSSRLLLVDALAMDFREVSVQRNPACPVCGDAPSIRELKDYQ
jgi:molybdopterin/thiamine biosynthesis adenylyltransferase